MECSTAGAQRTFRLSRDAALLNRVINHPAVHPYVSYGLGEMDLSGALLDPQNIFIANDYGGFLLIKDGDVFEVHTQFMPEFRGAEVLEAAKEVPAYVFTKTDALGIRTMVGNNPAAERLTRNAGLYPCGEASINGHPVTVFVMTVKDWAKRLDVCRLLQ